VDEKVLKRDTNWIKGNIDSPPPLSISNSCDIILGMEWLCTLDPITMDLQKLTMQFQ
jgi:hypothetical protein